MALEMRPDCEKCGTDLPAHLHGAFICSFECTFCADCSDAMDEICPNCGGEMADRPARSKKHWETQPPSTVRKFCG